MKVSLWYQDCGFEATYKSNECWCRLHTIQIKIQFLIDQTLGSEITHAIHIQECFSLTFVNNKWILLVHDQYYELFVPMFDILLILSSVSVI